MIPVEFPEVKKIIVYETIEYSVQEMVENAPPGVAFFWQDGFLYAPISMGRKITEEALMKDGTSLIRAFVYAKYPKYTSNIKNNLKQEVPCLIDKSIIPKLIIKSIKDKDK